MACRINRCRYLHMKAQCFTYSYSCMFCDQCIDNMTCTDKYFDNSVNLHNTRLLVARRPRGGGCVPGSQAAGQSVHRARRHVEWHSDTSCPVHEPDGRRWRNVADDGCWRQRRHWRYVPLGGGGGGGGLLGGYMHQTIRRAVQSVTLFPCRWRVHFVTLNGCRHLQISSTFNIRQHDMIGVIPTLSTAYQSLSRVHRLSVSRHFIIHYQLLVETVS